MPLSKKRMRERKRADRLGLTKPNVKPKTVRVYHNGRYQDIVVPEIDADGNPIPEYD